MRRDLIYLLSIATLASLLVGTAVAAQSTQVLVVPASSVVGVGAAVTVEVQVHDVLDLYAVDLHLVFDPALLEVQDADGNSANGTQVAAGNLLSSPYGFTAANQADNITGQIRYVYSLLSPAAPVSGSGVLVRITFLARSAGSSPLQLEALLANDRAGYIPAQVSGGLIVVSGDTATPTITVATTRTPTPSATHTPTFTATSVATVTRTATPIVTFTPSHTPTHTRTRTATPTAIFTATRTGTPPVPDHFLWLPLLLRDHLVPTLTPVSSATPTPTASAIPSLTASATPSIEATPSPSATGSITPEATPSPTLTQIASVTPSPILSVTPTAEATPSPTPAAEQLLLNHSFESDEVWVLEGGMKPVYTMARAHSGVRSMRLGIILPESQRVWSSVWQEVDLPGSITGVHLSLYYFPVGWPEHTDDIYLYVTRANDGTILFSDRWMRWEQTWHPYTADLSALLAPYTGQRVRLRIGAYNDGDGMTAVYLDDVELWVTY